MSYAEQYITIKNYLQKKRHRNLYKGFVIGMGYTDIVSISILPRNMLGYQHPTSYNDRQPAFLPDQETFPMIIKLQSEDITKDTIKHSLKGIFVDGELVFIYTQGDDMAYVAEWFDATMADIYQWNPSLPKDGKIMNHQAIVIKDKKPTGRRTDVQQKAVISTKSYAGTQDTSFIFPFLKNEESFIDINNPKIYPGIKIYESKYVTGGVTIPDIGIFVDNIHDTALIQHEYGHYLNYKDWESMWGSGIASDMYLLIIALPSLLNMGYDKIRGGYTHGNFYTERWADEYAKDFFGENYKTHKRFSTYGK